MSMPEGPTPRPEQQWEDAGLVYMTDPETRPSQPHPLTREAKNRIEDFYRQRVIKNNRPEDHMDWGTFEEFNESLSREAGVRIPDNLSSQLDLPLLKWRAFGFESPIVLMIGRTPKTVRGTLSGIEPMTDDINMADATIEIARSAERIDRGFPYWIVDKFSPFHLHITGADRQKMKIITTVYDLRDKGRLTELNVSIPIDEHLELGKFIGFENANSKTVPIPANKNNPYKTAGLITQAMCETLNRSMRESNQNAIRVSLSAKMNRNHERVLVFKCNIGNSGVGKELQIPPYLKEFGYYREVDNGILKIGLRNEAARSKDLVPWEITVPESLLKA